MSIVRSLLFRREFLGEAVFCENESGDLEGTGIGWPEGKKPAPLIGDGVREEAMPGVYTFGELGECGECDDSGVLGERVEEARRAESVKTCQRVF